MGNLRSTFPLDEGSIAREALGKILIDPISWVPLLPAVAAYTIFDVPAVFAFSALALVLCAVGWYWRRQWPSLIESLRSRIIADHNRSQDAALQATADEFASDGHPAFARKLTQFLELKRTAEARIHEDRRLTSQKIQLEQLIDSLCFGVRDQLQSLAASNRTELECHATLDQVDAAFATLQATVAELDTILDPISGSAAGAEASIEEISRRLREEAEIARRIQARLRTYGETSPSPEPPELRRQ